jgi:hypothetical protein
MKTAKDMEKTDGSVQPSTLRLWPGVVIVVLQWLLRFAIPAIVPDGMVIGILAALLGVLGIVVWWIFFSRASRLERYGALPLIILSLFATSFFLDKSIATANMGLMFIIYSTPVMCLALVGWAVATRNLSTPLRRLTMILTILLASGMWILLRTNGKLMRNDYLITQEKKALNSCLKKQMKVQVLAGPVSEEPTGMALFVVSGLRQTGQLHHL